MVASGRVEVGRGVEAAAAMQLSWCFLGFECCNHSFILSGVYAIIILMLSFFQTLHQFCPDVSSLWGSWVFVRIAQYKVELCHLVMDRMSSPVRWTWWETMGYLEARFRFHVLWRLWSHECPFGWRSRKEFTKGWSHNLPWFLNTIPNGSFEKFETFFDQSVSGSNLSIYNQQPCL